MGTYCVTAANHNNPNDDRVSDLKLWEETYNATTKKTVWTFEGKKSLNYVAKLLAEGHTVISGKEIKENGKVVRINNGAALELELRIAKNDSNFKITDLPEF